MTKNDIIKHITDGDKIKVGDKVYVRLHGGHLEATDGDLISLYTINLDAAKLVVKATVSDEQEPAPKPKNKYTR